MSTTTLSSHKKPLHHHRNNSDELDVFEASRYFSDYNDNNTLVNANENNMLFKQQKQQGYYFRQGRASLDMPSSKQQQQQQHYYKQLHQNYTITQLDHHRHRNHHNNHQAQVKEVKKQPSSPGGKLAHFLNTLFNQKLMITSKNKKQPKSIQSIKKNEYEDQNPNTRKQRRNSISHFNSSNSIVHPNSGGFPAAIQKNSIDTKSMYSSSSSKSCQNKVTSISDYKQVLANFSKYKIHDQSQYINANPKNYDQNKKFNKDQVVNVDNGDDGEESDVSSDLFELQIDSDYGFSSTGLPVYETTCMDNIKRPASTSKHKSNNDT